MTPYRAARERAPARAVVLCPSCGLRVRVEGDELFCSQCAAREPALREDVGLRAAPEIIELEEGKYTELRAAARALGRDADALKMVVRCDGLSCVTSLDLNSGTPWAVEYSIATRGLPTINFRRESGDDVVEKERGVAREVQTGDADFDGAVYIESDAADEDVLTVLSAKAVRSAIVALLRLHGPIRLDESGVALKDDDRPPCFDDKRVVEILALLRTIAGAPRPTAPGEVIAKTPARRVAGLVVLTLPVAIGMLFHGCGTYPPLSSGNLILSGAVLGLAVAWFLNPLLRRAVAGRSTSHTELVPLQMAAFVGVPLCGIATAIVLNGTLDGSSEWVETGVVQETSYDDEDNVTTAKVRTDRRTVTLQFYDSPRRIANGDVATLWLRKGLFGEAWKSRRATVKTRDSVALEK